MMDGRHHHYVTKPFGSADDGQQCAIANAAVMSATSLAIKPKNVGALAFSQLSDLTLGELSDAVPIPNFGDVPNGLSDL